MRSEYHTLNPQKNHGTAIINILFKNHSSLYSPLSDVKQRVYWKDNEKHWEITKYLLIYYK